MHTPLCSQAKTANQVDTETTGSTRANRCTHGRDEHVQNAKCGGGSQRQDGNLFGVQRFLGNEGGAKSHNQTFNQVFNGAFHQLCNIDVHLICGIILYTIA